MSKTEEAEADVCCANCGAAEIDDIKLEECDDCDLVKYCSDKCREEHRELHEEECRKHNKLFTQPDGTHDGECPLCFLPLPLDKTKSGLWTCCSEIICMGCKYAHFKSNGGDRCPFCREPAASKEGGHKRMMKRIKANDPAALCFMGTECYKEGDYDGAFKYWIKAADLGYPEAHYELGLLYGKGHGVEMDDFEMDVKMDDEKAIRFLERPIYHFKIAAIGGHPSARYALAYFEESNGKIERAVKHLIIAANLGYEAAMKDLWKQYSAGNITKEDLDATLRTHQAALDAMKSEQRDAAAKVFSSESVL